jgi:hypothetical protein
MKVFITGRNLPKAPWLIEPMVITIDVLDTQQDIKTFISHSLRELEDEGSVVELLEEVSEDEIATSLMSHARGM